MNKISSEAGNVIFFIMLGVLLLGLVTAAIRGSGMQGANIDRETLILDAGRVRQYTNELERGIAFILRDSISEVDLRFAHGDAPSDYGDITDQPYRQVFHRTGGGAEYRLPPGTVNDGSKWEFYGNSHLPDVGTGRADLIAVLPNVKPEFCEHINGLIGYDTQPLDTGGASGCLYAAASERFGDSKQYDTTPNTVDEGSFSVRPAMQGCVKCDDGSFHFYHVLHAR